MPSDYSLEIYEPQSMENAWIVFHSTSPFMSISAGDIINPGIWEGSKSPMKVLRVLNVEHIVWQSKEGDVKQKVMVYSEEVEGTSELRLRRSGKG